MTITKTQFDLHLYDDHATHRKLEILSSLEAMFDDARNYLPPEYFVLSNVPVGSTIRVTMELINNPTIQQ